MHAAMLVHPVVTFVGGIGNRDIVDGVLVPVG